MTTQEIFVENIKCSGGMKSIRSDILKISGATAVSFFKEVVKAGVTGGRFFCDLV